MKSIKVILWIIWIGLVGLSVYYLKEPSLRLLWIDIKTGFRYVPQNMHKIVIILVIFCVVILISSFLLKRGLITLSWKISVGKRKRELYISKFPYTYITTLAGISFLILLSIMCLHDTLNEQRGSRFECTLVAHALGGIDGRTYTNSKEALLYNYSLGHRAFEVDFSITSDEKLVCLHDWNHAAKMLECNEVEILSKDEFESNSIWHRYTPISVQELLVFMSQHEDVWIVTDTKETTADLIALEFSYIVDTAKELGIEQVLDRIAVQIYNKEMYLVVCEIYRFPSAIFTLYQYWDGDVKGFPDICRFCVYNGISIVTMPYNCATQEVMKIAEEYGIKVYVHTVNDVKTVLELKDLGVTGVYTDYLTAEMLESN